jgi:hypothetical protein
VPTENIFEGHQAENNTRHAENVPSQEALRREDSKQREHFNSDFDFEISSSPTRATYSLLCNFLTNHSQKMLQPVLL